MNTPFVGEYCDEVGVEVGTLEKKKTLRVVKREITMNVLSSTWVAKCKR